jgi:hypothetical protein
MLIPDQSLTEAVCVTQLRRRSRTQPAAARILIIS